MTHTLSLNKIVEILEENHLLVENHLGKLETEIQSISYDSSKITENTLFFCKGIHFKADYLVQALEKGAIAYVSEEKYEVETDSPYLLVNNIRRAISILAPIFYENPANDLNLIGITGTKGKTTVAYFLKNILDAASATETGLMGTEETITGLRKETSHNTTPEPFDLQMFLDEAREAKLPYFTMEVTSQAYKMDRVLGMTFEHAIWLNIAEDHISPAEHPDFEDYISCKLQLMTHGKEILINHETDFFERVYETAKSSELAPKIYTYASDKHRDRADFYYTDVKRKGSILSFKVVSQDGAEDFAISTLGLFNVENATAAVAQAKLLGISSEAIRTGLLKTQIPGRMNIFENKGVTVVVDYAHNLMSFTALFKSLRHDFPTEKIISVGGGPGEKAYQRRKDFADVVGKYSDYIYLTAEDPQFEDPQKICEEIASYMPDAHYEIIVDRTEAVTRAIQSAKSGEIVVLLAKGTEAFQKVRGVWEPYLSDVTLAQNLLEAL
ncbi:MAG: UDP-N-acetylmuramoyl-L-alanyl-D-glutamate--2,6-diaminopimelate ligase [Streptococcaceae bacterium]|jgi:UDP-N-acetylmuramyl-tripeptide synthetase|nr:UDP-N-acetylmuramoyl-L-alanyl-D-glutamate--2,6-diaminopimelate ligase [Streptococcaceae bacterium]